MEMKQLMTDLADRIQKTANVKAVFGEPIREGENTIVPVARVLVRGGGGGELENKSESDQPSKQKRGMGLGLNIVSAPVGYIRMAPEGATFVPVIDRNRMIYGVMGLVGLSLWVVKLGVKLAGKRQSSRE